jgi:hypothetical protein
MLGHGRRYDDDAKAAEVVRARDASHPMSKQSLGYLMYQSRIRFLSASTDPYLDAFCKYCGFVQAASHFRAVEAAEDDLSDDDGGGAAAAANDDSNGVQCIMWEARGDDGEPSRADKWCSDGVRRTIPRGIIPGIDQSLYSVNPAYWQKNKKKQAGMAARRRSASST